MLRSAAKNHERVAVVVDPDDYPQVIEELRADRRRARRRRAACDLARKAFAHTAAYDAAIAAYLTRACRTTSPRARRPRRPGASSPTPSRPVARGSTTCATARTRTSAPRSTRDAARRWPATPPTRPTIAGAEVLGGKQLSLQQHPRPRRRARPGASSSPSTDRGRRQAQQPVRRRDRRRPGRRLPAGRAAAIAQSAFGGIVAVNREVDEAARRARWSRPSSSAWSRPGYTAAAREVLAGKKNLRLVAAPGRSGAPARGRPRLVRAARSPAALLVQTVDTGMVGGGQRKVATKRAPTDEELADLDFAWSVVQARQVERDRLRARTARRSASAPAR